MGYPISENNRRSKAYTNDNQEYLYFEDINNLLQEREVYQHGLAEKYPTLFVFGLPRSGTTLLYQFISKFYQIGYFNNVMAKFWKAPLFALKLSNALQMDKLPFHFESNYGRSIDLGGPHEFSYFFHDLFKISTIEEFADFSEDQLNFTTDDIRTSMVNFQYEINKPLVFKSNFAVNFMGAISEALQKSFFIYIERDKIDVSQSILKARKKFYGDYNKWWATYSDSYFKSNLPFEQQIFNQIHELEEIFEAKFAKVSDQNKIKITYQDLCENPQQVHRNLLDKLNRLGPVSSDNHAELPQKLHFSRFTGPKIPEEKILFDHFKSLIK